MELQEYVRVLFPDQQKVMRIPVKEYLRRVVPAEMYANWPLEALKAQAVAARSYTYRAMGHPRHPPYADVCTDSTHCQNYDPQRVHHDTDVAVAATQRQVILYQKRVADALYSANCGGRTHDSEEIFSSKIGYLRGVDCPNPGPPNGHGVGLCQWGARDMADQGADYRSILSHYYTGVEIREIDFLLHYLETNQTLSPCWVG